MQADTPDSEFVHSGSSLEPAFQAAPSGPRLPPYVVPEVVELRRGAATRVIENDLELEQRTRITGSITSAHFPATRDDLLQTARRQTVERDVVVRLGLLPAKTIFDNADDVWSALVGRRETEEPEPGT
jgi:hypothetical protein